MEHCSNAKLDEALQLKEYSAGFDRVPFSKSELRLSTSLMVPHHPLILGEWVGPDSDSFESLHYDTENIADPSLSNSAFDS